MKDIDKYLSKKNHLNLLKLQVQIGGLEARIALAKDMMETKCKGWR